MAFREKIAWLTLVTMLVAYGAYFGWIGPAARFGETILVDIVWSFGLVAGLQAVMAAGAIALALASRREAQAPADERDRAIGRRGTSVGYYILTVGIILVGVVMPFSSPPWQIVNAALAVIVLAEAVHQVLVLISYRRGWHG